MRKLRLIIVVLSSLSVLTLSGASEQQTDNSELTTLYQQDQAARKAADIDWSKLVEEDQIRQDRVRQLLAADSVVTANDFLHAAMIFQHGGDSSSYRLAHELVVRSVELDSTNNVARWLTAATYDRYLLSLNQPQWYGTQYLIWDGTTYLQPIDTTKVTDSIRVTFGVRTLEEIHAYLTEQNGEDLGLLIVPDSIRAKILH